MKKRIVSLILTLVTLWTTLVACQSSVQTPQTPTDTPIEEMPKVENYEKMMNNLKSFPISFQYNDKQYTGFAGFTEITRKTTQLERGYQTNILLRHPEIACDFELITSVYPYENAYEYVVYIENNGVSNSGVFSNLDYVITFEGENPMLKGIKGDAGGQYYTPYQQNLKVRTSYKDVSTSGRPSHNTFPYYNLSYGDGGSFIAIGWSGRWRAEFNYYKEENITILRTGQYKVQTYIAPGETLRMPLMGIVDYKGLNEDEQTNAWRHYYLNDVMRKIDGDMTPTYAGISYGATGTTTAKTLLVIKSFLERGIKPEILWIDAGWYTGVNNETVYWPAVGTHNVNTSRFPDKMATIGEVTAANDMEFLLWFEPEIVRLEKSAFLNYHKSFREEWLLSIKGTSDYLVNLGDETCRNWIFAKICNVIDTAGVTAYRQDFNTDPAAGWDQGDGPLRVGITENLYIQGYLALWDMLIARYPDIYIDSCASGGGRNDLESMKRGVPLHYSDWFDDDSRRNDYDMKSKMTQALFAWLPYFKNEIYAVENRYQTRMNLAPFSLYNIPNALDPNANWTLLASAYAEHHLVREYFYADYYQLTTWSTNKDRWNGWEFYDPETGGGFAVMFCHETTSSLTTTVKLKGLDKNATYRIVDMDGLLTITAKGSELLDKGFALTVPEKPYGALLMIEKIQ